MKLNIIKNRKIFFTFSGVLVLAGLLLWIAWGLNLGIDFTGGSLLEVEYTRERPSLEEVQSRLSDLNLSSLNIQPAGEKGYIFRFGEVSEETHQEILKKLRNEDIIDNTGDDAFNETDSSDNADLVVEGGSEESGVVVEDIDISSLDQEKVLVEQRFDSIGPVIGKELRTKSLFLIIVVILAIIAFIAYAFRKVSYPVSSWNYGLMAIIALIHDIIITIGIFVAMGHFVGWELNVSFVAALLTILGYSVNDTIVVLDRIRENLHKYEGDFSEIIEKSISETITRSINTSITTLLVLLTIFIFGGATIQVFIFALMVGVTLGTYSSIFIASPMLYVWYNLQKKFRQE